MRRSYQYRKLERHSRKPAELLLVPMIDIFTVLVTFLLMTAVFSRTVILQLNLPAPQTEFKEPPPGLQLEVMVRKDLIQVADRNTGPLATLPNTPGGYNFDGLTDYLKRVKAKFPEKTEASILLEPDTAWTTRAYSRRVKASTRCRRSCSRIFPSAMRRRRAPSRRGRRQRAVRHRR